MNLAEIDPDGLPATGVAVEAIRRKPMIPRGVRTEKSTAGRLLVTGASGFVGGNLVRIASVGWEVTGIYHSHRPSIEGAEWLKIDLTDARQTARAIDSAHPDAVVHLAAMSNIDLCERERAMAYAANVTASGNVGDACARAGCRLVAISTDNVFDGKRGNYSENDPPHPVNYYGQTKVEAEQTIVHRHPDALILRIPLMLGFPVTDASSFLHSVLTSLRAGKPVTFFTEEYRSPCDVFTLCDALMGLAESGLSGVLHIGGTERVSRADIGRSLLRRLGLPDDRCEYATAADRMEGRAPRPPDVSFNVTGARNVLRTPLLGLEASMDRIWELTDPDALAW